MRRRHLRLWHALNRHPTISGHRSNSVLEDLIDEIISLDDFAAVAPFGLRKRHPHATKIDVLRQGQVACIGRRPIGDQQVLQDSAPGRDQIVGAQERQMILDRGDVFRTRSPAGFINVICS